MWTTSPGFSASKSSKPTSTLPTGLRGLSLRASPRKMQRSPPDGRKATSPRAYWPRGFSTPTLSSAKRLANGGWMVTLLSNGIARSRALTVSGARCLKREILASPFPLNEAMHSTLETEPALGSDAAVNGGVLGGVLIALLGRLAGKTLNIRPRGAGNLRGP